MNGNDFLSLLNKNFENWKIFKRQSDCGYDVDVDGFDIKFLTWGKILNDETIWYVSCYKITDRWIMIPPGREELFLKTLSSEIETILNFQKSRKRLKNLLSDLEFDLEKVERKYNIKLFLD
jgi:hypothetical protein